MKNISHQVNVCDSSLSWSSCTFFVPWSKNFKEAAGRKGVSKRKALFQALSQHCDENWICLILGLLIRVSLGSTLFSNFRHCW